MFTLASGKQLRIGRVIKRLKMWCGRERFTGDFLVVPVPYGVVMGLEWLMAHKAARHLHSDKLRTYVNGKWCGLPVIRSCRGKQKGNNTEASRQRAPAEQAYDIITRQVSGMWAEEAAALLRQPPRRCSSYVRAGIKVPIDLIVQQARDNTRRLNVPVQRLNLMLALHEADEAVGLRHRDERQEALCCTLIGNHPPPVNQISNQTHENTSAEEGEEESPGADAQLEYHQFDEWVVTSREQGNPRQILEVLREHRKVFPDALPAGMPPKLPYDHRTLLGPGKLPAKPAICRMSPEQLTFHKHEITKLVTNGWIGPTYSSICAPMIMVGKGDDGTGQR